MALRKVAQNCWFVAVSGGMAEWTGWDPAYHTELSLVQAMVGSYRDRGGCERGCDCRRLRIVQPLAKWHSVITFLYHTQIAAAHPSTSSGNGREKYKFADTQSDGNTAHTEYKYSALFTLKKPTPPSEHYGGWVLIAPCDTCTSSARRRDIYHINLQCK